MVTGVFEAIEENKYPTNVKVRFDEPQQWGDDLYTEDWAWGRKTERLFLQRVQGIGQKRRTVIHFQLSFAVRLEIEYLVGRKLVVLGGTFNVI